VVPARAWVGRRAVSYFQLTILSTSIPLWIHNVPHPWAARVLFGRRDSADATRLGAAAW
jgi:hypothetical protein